MFTKCKQSNLCIDYEIALRNHLESEDICKYNLCSLYWIRHVIDLGLANPISMLGLA